MPAKWYAGFFKYKVLCHKSWAKKKFDWHEGLTHRPEIEMDKVYDNDFTSIIYIYFYETFSTLSLNLKVLAFHSLDTLSDVRMKAFTLLF